MSEPIDAVPPTFAEHWAEYAAIGGADAPGSSQFHRALRDWLNTAGTYHVPSWIAGWLARDDAPPQLPAAQG